MKTIIKLLKIGSKAKIKSAEKLRTKLLKAIADKNEKMIANLLADVPETLRRKILNPKVDYRSTSYTEDPLHFAIRNRLTKSVKLFLPYIKDINRQPYAVGTSLHIACQIGVMSIVRLLLTRNDINLNAKNYYYGAGSFGRDKRHATPLHTLIDYIEKFGDVNQSRINIAKLLLKDRRINVNAANVHGQTVLEKAKKSCEKHSSKLPRELVEILAKKSIERKSYAEKERILTA